MLSTKQAATITSEQQSLNYVMVDTGKPIAWRRARPSLLSRIGGSLWRTLSARAASHDHRLQFARRRSGTPWLAPAVAQLRTGQFVALVERRGDHYLMRDPALHVTRWVTQDALDEETSGYVATTTETLPAGWETISSEAMPESPWACDPGEADDLEPPPDDPPGSDTDTGTDSDTDSDSPDDGASCPVGMPVYSLQRHSASLWLHDKPIGYTPPRGPAVWFSARYHQREIAQPQVFTFSNLGPKWLFDWMEYVVDYPVTCGPLAECFMAQTSVMLRGGGVETYVIPDANGQFAPNWGSRAVLKRTSTNPLRYERYLRDGTIERFGQPDGLPEGQVRYTFLTELIDPSGEQLQFTYDAQFRLTAVTDALGQVTTLSYELPTDPLKITKVTDPFGRVATMTYTPNGHLASLTDMIGLTSTFTYTDNDFIASMTTPYGVTSFRKESPLSYYPRIIEAHDPLGGSERVEYHVQHFTLSATEPSTEVPTGFDAYNVDLNKYVTLCWGKRAMAQPTRSPATATVTHWLLGGGPERNGAVTESVPHSVKRPLERRVWYAYDGQTTNRWHMVGVGRRPTVRARVLDDGSVQRHQATYNALGHVTSRTDPLGRKTTYNYAANGIDLQEVRQVTGASTSDLLAQYSNYNSQHLPGTITDAATQNTSLTYNTHGQVLTITNAKNETTTYAYDGNGYLHGVTGAMAGATTSYTYDAQGRVHTVTDSDGYVVTTDYDNFDRPVKTTYPDSTFEQTVYDKLDPARRRDRLGRWTYIFYDALRRLIATRDPLGRTISWQWCGCGSVEALIDAKGHKTRWEHDLQGRVTREVRADATTATSYVYEPSSGRLKQITDPKQQIATYTYNLDDTLQQVAYTNATIATPSVSYTYETAYKRRATMVDGIGTTTYAYKPAGVLGAGRLASVDGPLAEDTITYGHDELGRVTLRAINGAANQTTQVYDALWRITTETTPLGTFTYAYDGVTWRLASVTYPDGQTSGYAYYGNGGDHRLQTIHHKRADTTTLSKFDYTYDAVGNIVTWRQQADAANPMDWRYSYDAADQLVTAALWTTNATPAVLKRYGYTYDPAANRLSEQTDDAITLSSHDSLNRLQSLMAGGPLRVAGTINEPATVTIQGKPATVAGDNTFNGTVSLAPGTNTFTVTAVDAAANGTTQTYAVDVAVPARTFTYDANGNLTTDGDRSFDWDAKNRLVAVSQGTHRSEFICDGSAAACGSSRRTMASPRATPG